ncbi:MAG: cation transporter [Cytophagaceae bacterium]
MKKSEFLIKKMDCPSEENMIRMKLEGLDQIKTLTFDIPGRKLEVYHEGGLEEIERSIDRLDLNSSLISSRELDDDEEILIEPEKNQRRVLWTVFIINLTFFIGELIAGLLSRSMGLVADSLDMLADAVVYGLSLLAVGGALSKKKRVAKLSGYFQMALAIIGFGEVTRRFFESEKIPDFQTMIIVSILALAANAICLYLLLKSKSREAHMQASTIFTSNDIVINSGVILAGVLVYLTQSNYPDLIIGTIVFLIVIRGAVRILQIAK